MMNYRFNKKNKQKYTLAHYLLSLQLIIAGHNMTADEAEEMYSHKEYLDKDFMFINQFTIDNLQWKEWYNIAIKEVMKHLKVSKKYAKDEILFLDFSYGLCLKE